MDKFRSAFLRLLSVAKFARMPVTGANENLNDWISIGITTKDRWTDLRTTLRRLIEFGLGHLSLLVIDDGSSTSCPFSTDIWPGRFELERFVPSAGLIAQRNRLARKVGTKYLLSLDDDSYPVQGSLAEAIHFCEQKPDLLCLSFPIYNPVQKAYQSRSISEQPYLVRSFIGCGHLMNIPFFCELGGYREELIHQGEEVDLAARGFQRDFRCFHFPGLTIHHTASNQSRNWERMDYFGSRNSLLWNDWFVPPSLRLYQQCRTFVGRSWLFLKVKRSALWTGQLAALEATRKFKRFRRPLSKRQYKLWRQLPPH